MKIAGTLIDFNFKKATGKSCQQNQDISR